MKNVPNVGIELRATCMPSGYASDRATAPGHDPVGSVKTFGIFSVVTDDSGSKCFEDKERLNSLCKQIHRTVEG